MPTFGQLTFVNEVDPGSGLKIAHGGDRLGQALVADVRLRPNVVRRRQCTYMRSENSSFAASHV
jgi:hypothetical protein